MENINPRIASHMFSAAVQPNHKTKLLWMHFVLVDPASKRGGFVVGWEDPNFSSCPVLHDLAQRFPHHRITTIWFAAESLLEKYSCRVPTYFGDPGRWRDTADLIGAMLKNPSCRFVEDLTEPTMTHLFDAVGSMSSATTWTAAAGASRLTP